MTKVTSEDLLQTFIQLLGWKVGREPKAILSSGLLPFATDNSFVGKALEVRLPFANAAEGLLLTPRLITAAAADPCSQVAHCARFVGAFVGQLPSSWIREFYFLSGDEWYLVLHLAGITAEVWKIRSRKWVKYLLQNVPPLPLGDKEAADIVLVRAIHCLLGPGFTTQNLEELDIIEGWRSKRYEEALKFRFPWELAGWISAFHRARIVPRSKDQQRVSIAFFKLHGLKCPATAIAPIMHLSADVLIDTRAKCLPGQNYDVLIQRSWQSLLDLVYKRCVVLLPGFDAPAAQLCISELRLIEGASPDYVAQRLECDARYPASEIVRFKTEPITTVPLNMPNAALSVETSFKAPPVCRKLCYDVILLSDDGFRSKSLETLFYLDTATVRALRARALAELQKRPGVFELPDVALLRILAYAECWNISEGDAALKLYKISIANPTICAAAENLIGDASATEKNRPFRRINSRLRRALKEYLDVEKWHGESSISAIARAMKARSTQPVRTVILRQVGSLDAWSKFAAGGEANRRLLQDRTSVGEAAVQADRETQSQRLREYGEIFCGEHCDKCGKFLPFDKNFFATRSVPGTRGTERTLRKNCIPCQHAMNLAANRKCVNSKERE